MGIVSLVITVLDNHQVAISFIIPPRVNYFSIHCRLDWRTHHDPEIQAVMPGMEVLS